MYRHEDEENARSMDQARKVDSTCESIVHRARTLGTVIHVNEQSSVQSRYGEG